MSLLEEVIGFVAPPQCLVCATEGTALCRTCIKSNIVPYGETCWSCGVRSPGGRTCQKCRLTATPSYVWLSTIYDGTAAELLKSYKFGHLRAAADDLSAIMAKTMLDFFDLGTVKAANYKV